MAPPGMLSYLRHRRTPSSSNPTSPTHSNVHSPESTLVAADEIFPQPTRAAEAESSHTDQSPHISSPPTLAPIPRIASTYIIAPDDGPLSLENVFKSTSS